MTISNLKEKSWLQGDMVIWMVFLFLCMISIIEVYSATSTMTYSNGHYWDPVLRHSAFLGIGIVFAWIITQISCNWFKLGSLVVLALSILLLIIVLFTTKINGGARWLEIGKISFQPSELAKMGLIGFTAFILSTSRDEKGASKIGTKWVLGVTAFVLLLIATENLSTAGIIGITIFGILFYAQAPKKYLAIIVGLVLAGAILGGTTVYTLSKSEETMEKMAQGPLHRIPTWVHRLTTNHEIPEDPNKYPLTENIQVTHANIAIGTCGIIGKGPGNSVQRDYLPQAYSDFIYAIIIEETGIFGLFGVMFLYLLLMWQSMKIASRCKSRFPSYLVMGLALMIVIQAMVNMAVATGAFPVTGQPLPLISRGGTSTFVNCAYFGMILSVSRTAKKKEEYSI
ncbi:MAG: FtsW/RodA/SpoVE family cell cycle protein [Bacteroidaceae bacterium]|nr:FtsW/RodA/SpoVE family cell cycle protein [Bacteroidaceae bacterium]